MRRSRAASSRAPATPALQADGAAPAESGRQTRKRVERPEIDLDGNIREARATIQRAQAALTQARQQAKADRRRKARLIRKACHLSPADLERIAVLKRCGFSGAEREASMPQIPDAANPDAAPVADDSTVGGTPAVLPAGGTSRGTSAPAAAGSSAGPAGAAAARSPASDVEAADSQARVDDDPLR